MTLTGTDLNELCSPSFLEGVDVAPVTELRARRAVCQRAEGVLSYLRRVVQGEMDLLLAELALRRHGGESNVGRLVEDLPSILASAGSLGAEPNHLPPASLPGESVVADDVSLEELLAEVLSADGRTDAPPPGLLSGANLCALEMAELDGELERLREAETTLSRRRRILHDQIDVIQAAIVDRYKSGAADPDSLLA